MKRYTSIYKKYQIMEMINNKLKLEIPKICKVFEQFDIDYCLIGGASLPTYNLNRATEDVDFLVFVNDKQKLESLIGVYFKPQFPNSKRNLIWNDGKILVEFLYSGEVSGATGGLEFKKPSDLSEKTDGMKIITLPNLIQYKLSSGMYGRRTKDLSDVEELIKLNNLSNNYCETNNFREDFKQKWQECWLNAEFDKQNKRW